MPRRNDDMTPLQWLGLILVLALTAVFWSLYAKAYTDCKARGGVPIKGAIGWVECIEQ